MANQTYSIFNPTSATVGTVPANSRGDVVIDDATGIATFNTYLNAGCIVFRKDTANRNQLHARFRRAGLHFPGS